MTGCLTPEQIEMLGRNAVTAGNAEQLRRHVERCDACRRRVDECQANEEVLCELKQLPQSNVLGPAIASPEPDKSRSPPGVRENGPASGSEPGSCETDAP